MIKETLAYMKQRLRQVGASTLLACTLLGCPSPVLSQTLAMTHQDRQNSQNGANPGGADP
ncbi:hypothetical protein HMF3257_21825 [Spirosoma telluris]|uniref:Uncharacterized protein n=2 Tax=Spirosoma telluris TaxID=2183553 RepID=A0A327NQ78_9BACT|nr:hypothetical protein HMF3257_21825 [Spirosoma telluris]